MDPGYTGEKIIFGKTSEGPGSANVKWKNLGPKNSASYKPRFLDAIASQEIPYIQVPYSLTYSLSHRVDVIF